MNWKNKKWFNYAEEKNGLKNYEPHIVCFWKYSLDKKKSHCLYNPDCTNIELKGLRVKVCNQNILINAEEK